MSIFSHIFYDFLSFWQLQSLKWPKIIVSNVDSKRHIQPHLAYLELSFKRPTGTQSPGRSVDSSIISTNPSSSVFDPNTMNFKHIPSSHHTIITSQPLDAVESDTHRLHAKPHGPVPRVRLAVFCLQLFIHLWGVNTSGWELAPDLQRFDVQPGFHIESKNANKISKIYIMIAMIVGICTHGSLNQTDFGW